MNSKSSTGARLLQPVNLSSLTETAASRGTKWVIHNRGG